MSDQFDLSNLGGDTSDICPRDGCGTPIEDHTLRDLRDHMMNLDTPMPASTSLFGAQEIDPSAVAEVLSWRVVGLVAHVQAMSAENPIRSSEVVGSIGIQFNIEGFGSTPMIGIADRSPGFLAGFARDVNTAVN
ncbi:MAG: hypothetical protein GY925_26310, partial [Actinomycetia bacterium]|nr:hypothetical protein [Actinomycetes bacterium]